MWEGEKMNESDNKKNFNGQEKKKLSKQEEIERYFEPPMPSEEGIEYYLQHPEENLILRAEAEREKKKESNT